MSSLPKDPSTVLKPEDFVHGQVYRCLTSNVCVYNVGGTGHSQWLDSDTMFVVLDSYMDSGPTDVMNLTVLLPDGRQAVTHLCTTDGDYYHRHIRFEHVTTPPA